MYDKMSSVLEETFSVVRGFYRGSQACLSTMPFDEYKEKYEIEHDNFIDDKKELEPQGVDPIKGWSFRGVHKAIVCGKIGQAPVQKILRNGKTVTIFTVGTGGMYDQRITGAEHLPRPAQWHRIAVHNEWLGAYAVQQLEKNSAVFIEGDIETRVYNDSITGQCTWMVEARGSDQDFKDPTSASQTSSLLFARSGSKIPTSNIQNMTIMPFSFFFGVVVVVFPCIYKTTPSRRPFRSVPSSSQITLDETSNLRGMDPLSVLREYAIRGELDRVVRSGDELQFGSDYAFPCSAVTGYRSKQGGFYTLDGLIFFARHHHLKHTEYLQSARQHRVPTVTFPDRKPILDYLLGRTASSDAVSLLPPPSSAVEEYRPDESSLPLDEPPSAAAAETLADVPSAAAATAVDYVAMIRSMERPLKDRESLLECRNRDFHAVLLASTKREEERQRLESQQRKDGLVAKTRLIGSDDHHRPVVSAYGGGGGGDDAAGAAAPKPKMHLKGSKIGEGVPIIMVPSAFQTLITIYNVKEFLEDGVFVPSDVKVKAVRGPKPDCVTVQKKLSRDRVVAAYEVRDKPSAFKPEDWDRVVAVFVLGKEWQFKDWPFRTHIEIFNKSESHADQLLANIKDIRTGRLLWRCGIGSKSSCGHGRMLKVLIEFDVCFFFLCFGLLLDLRSSSFA
ncbi:RNA pol II accessory factor, Cdc73 family [Musa troglodytarum]|uniref:RNA pol II accessory factor, Cdc73 family n=1 Tax=Musa troglodytarum TaxID=320322 RepID=A0A9E7HQ69_9LILI|nr:RNA pol II accessory factor, Cdc73 family [Musa troglodytarum]